MKPIYEPKGKAKEYGDLAINIYTGCPHRCFYCFAPNVLHKQKEDFHTHIEPRKNIVEEVCKKVFYPLVDEMNLLTLNEEEYKKAMKAFETYVQKYCRYKHYRDKERLQRGHVCTFAFPIGKNMQEFFDITKSNIRYNCSIETKEVV